MLKSRSLRLPAALSLFVLATGCGRDGDGGGNPNNPSPPPRPTFTLSGGTSESAPTTANKIPGAVVTVTDGSNVGKSTTADGAGNYQLSNLNSGTWTDRDTWLWLELWRASDNQTIASA